MILIASGAYVSSEFQVELGRIPPCLLPVGNKKLIELQISKLKSFFGDEEVFVTLPESYKLSNAESKVFKSLGVNLIFIPDDFKLTESILYVLNTHEYINKNEVLYLLHGDTLFSDFIKLNQPDILAVAKSFDSYYWEVVRSTSQHALVWCGFFSFSSISYLLKSLTLQKNDFVNAVKFYSDTYHLKEQEVDSWFDFGHANTYFYSRANITTERAFNNLDISDGIVKKSGVPKIKIEAEALWYLNAPVRLKKYLPVLIDFKKEENNSCYCLEYLPYIPLNELFVHGKNELLQWNMIIKKIHDYMNVSILVLDENIDLELIKKNVINLYVEKSKSRFSDYLNSKEISEDSVIIYKDTMLPKLSLLLDDCIKRVIDIDIFYGVMHGDLCFSNILFDSRGDRIKVIDPRGLNFDNDFTLYGDIKYDFAKLVHSIVGLYDFIISGYYKLEESANGSIQIIFDIDERTELITKQFVSDFKFKGMTVSEVMPLVVLLFLSMLPLHSDRPDRQKAMFYNALRLYYEYIV